MLNLIAGLLAIIMVQLWMIIVRLDRPPRQATPSHSTNTPLRTRDEYPRLQAERAANGALEVWPLS